MKILMAAFLGGILVFGWSFAVHMLLPLGEMGMHAPPDMDSEQALLGEMKDKLRQPGIYIFPGVGHDSRDEAGKEDYRRRMQAGPTALLVYNPTGTGVITPGQLGTEFLSNVLGAFVAALVVSRMRSAYPTRVFAVMLMGLFSWLAIEISYWNWYRFPSDYTVAQAIEHVGGGLIGGLAIAALVKGKT